MMTGEKQYESTEAANSNWDSVKDVPFAGDSRPLHRPRINPETIENFKEAERLSGDVLDLKIDDEHLSFTSLESFDPLVASTMESVEPSPLGEKILHIDEQIPSTLQETYEIENWQDKMFSLINACVTAPLMKELMDKEQIRPGLRELTPRQAIVLTTHMVTLFTKFDEQQESSINHSGSKKADFQDAMDILRDGWHNYRNPDWQGNGVCRNFASVTKAIFDTLKQKQKQPSKLNNTHCVLRGSTIGSRYRGAEDEELSFNSGHVWNDFVQLSMDGQSTQMMSIDVTAAEYDLDSGRPLGLEWMKRRLQMPMEIVAEAVPKDNPEQQPVKKMLGLYDEMLKKTLEEKSYSETAELAHQVISLMKGRDAFEIAKDHDANEAIAYAVHAFRSGIMKNFGKEELETIYGMYRNNEEIVIRLVDCYIQNKNKSKINHPSSFRFGDASLQKLIDERRALPPVKP